MAYFSVLSVFIVLLFQYFGSVESQVCEYFSLKSIKISFYLQMNLYFPVTSFEYYSTDPSVDPLMTYDMSATANSTVGSPNLGNDTVANVSDFSTGSLSSTGGGRYFTFLSNRELSVI